MHAYLLALGRILRAHEQEDGDDERHEEHEDREDR